MHRWQLFPRFAWHRWKPPDKAVAFLMAKKTTHTNQENSALLSFNFDLKFLIVWYCYTRSINSFALDFYRIIVIQTSFIT